MLRRIFRKWEGLVGTGWSWLINNQYICLSLDRKTHFVSLRPPSHILCALKGLWDNWRKGSKRARTVALCASYLTSVYFNRQISSSSCADIQRANDLWIAREFGHTPRYSLHSSVVWCWVGLRFSTKRFGKIYLPLLEDETHTLVRNVGKQVLINAV